MKLNWKEIRGTVAWLFLLVAIVLFFGAIFAARDYPDNDYDTATSTTQVDPKQLIPKEIVPVSTTISVKSVESVVNYSFEDKLIKIINQYRKDNGVPVLVKNSILTKSCQMKAKKINSDKVFAHYLPNSSKDSWMGEILEAGYPDEVDGFRPVFGENLACGFNTPEKVLEAWKKSPTHNHLLLSADYSEVGVATAQFKGEGLKGADWDCLDVVLHVAGKSELKYY